MTMNWETSMWGLNVFIVISYHWMTAQWAKIGKKLQFREVKMLVSSKAKIIISTLLYMLTIE